MEYAVILLLLKKRRKPMQTIDQGLRHLFATRNGAAAVPPKFCVILFNFSIINVVYANISVLH